MKKLLTVLVAGGVLASIGFSDVDASDNRRNMVEPKVNGKTYGQWSANWWQWQAKNYPGFSFGEGKVDCSLGQRGRVWFLAGAGTGNPEGPIPALKRMCEKPIPRNVHLFFPLVNAEGFPFPEGGPTDREVLDGLFSRNPEGPDGTPFTCGLFALVDDKPAVTITPIVRTQSPTFFYDDKAEGDEVPPNFSDISDGYWVMLPRLGRGEHTVQFGGALCNEDDPATVFFGLNVIYEFVVR